MPDTPSKAEGSGSTRPTSSIRGGRGRGRGAASSSTGERLASVRNASSAAGPGSKLVFKPSNPARRVKREAGTASTLLPAAPRAPETVKKEHVRKVRERPKLIESVSGPFAQGPAMISAAGRRGMTGAAVAPGVNPVATGSSSSGNALDAVEVLVTDHNLAPSGSLEVQTEEMAVRAAEDMARLALDYSAYECFLDDQGQVRKGLQEQMLVLQVPLVPEFELAPEILQRRLGRKQKKVARQRTRDLQQQQQQQQQQGVVDVDAVDVKPTMEQLLDVKPSVQELEDVKPDLARLAIDDEAETEAEVDGDEANGDLPDGRIGTLAVLKSGAVRLKIGDLLLDVSRGAECQFMRSLMALDSADSHSAFLLGNIDQLFLCTPDLEATLN